MHGQRRPRLPFPLHAPQPGLSATAGGILHSVIDGRAGWGCHGLPHWSVRIYSTAPRAALYKQYQGSQMRIARP